jgi:hypothetical protein
VPREKMAANYLSIKNWSQLYARYGSDEETLYRNKRNIFLSQTTLLGSFISMFHALEDLIDGLSILSLMDTVLAISLFIIYWINESGRHQLAKLILLTFLNLFFFLYSLITPREFGIYLFFFPWFAAAAFGFR